MSEHEMAFFTSFQDDTNIGDIIVGFKSVQQNPQNCDRYLKLSQADSEGFAHVVELNIVRKDLLGNNNSILLKKSLIHSLVN